MPCSPLKSRCYMVTSKRLQDYPLMLLHTHNTRTKDTEELTGKLSYMLTVRQLIGNIKLLVSNLSFPQLFGKELVPLPWPCTVTYTGAWMYWLGPVASTSLIPDYLWSDKPYIISLNRFPLTVQKSLRICQWFALTLVYETVLKNCSLADHCWSQEEI